MQTMPAAREHKLMVARHAKRVVARALELYPKIIGHCFAANTSRVKLTFHNPGTNDIFIAPVQIQTTGSNVAFNPSNAAIGGCIRVYGNGGQYTIEGECQGAYQAFAVTGAGTTNPLTVIDTNV